MTPPDQLPPTDHPDTPRSLTPLIDSLEPLERRVTIYSRGLVWDRIQATWVRVFRAHPAHNMQMRFTLTLNRAESA